MLKVVMVFFLLRVYYVAVFVPVLLLQYLNVILNDSVISVWLERERERSDYYTTRYIMSNDIFFTMSPACINYACH